MNRGVFEEDRKPESERDRGLGERVGFEAQLGEALEPSVQLPESEKTIAIGLG